MIARLVDVTDRMDESVQHMLLFANLSARHPTARFSFEDSELEIREGEFRVLPVDHPPAAEISADADAEPSTVSLSVEIVGDDSALWPILLHDSPDGETTILEGSPALGVLR